MKLPSHQHRLHRLHVPIGTVKTSLGSSDICWLSYYHRLRGDPSWPAEFTGRVRGWADGGEARRRPVVRRVRSAATFHLALWYVGWLPKVSLPRALLIRRGRTCILLNCYPGVNKVWLSKCPCNVQNLCLSLNLGIFTGKVSKSCLGRKYSTYTITL